MKLRYNVDVGTNYQRMCNNGTEGSRQDGQHLSTGEIASRVENSKKELNGHTRLKNQDQR